MRPKARDQSAGAQSGSSSRPSTLMAPRVRTARSAGIGGNTASGTFATRTHRGISGNCGRAPASTNPSPSASSSSASGSVPAHRGALRAPGQGLGQVRVPGPHRPGDARERQSRQVVRTEPVDVQFDDVARERLVDAPEPSGRLDQHQLGPAGVQPGLVVDRLVQLEPLAGADKDAHPAHLEHRRRSDVHRPHGDLVQVPSVAQRHDLTGDLHRGVERRASARRPARA